MATDAKMASQRNDAVRPTKLQGSGDEKYAALVRFFYYGARASICSLPIVYAGRKCKLSISFCGMRQRFSKGVHPYRPQTISATKIKSNL